MNTPILDFVRRYNKSGAVRLHMPGHKGAEFLGFEPYDITEIEGADNLHNPEGIIRESENNAASLFGSGDTLYSAGGSSQCVRAMLYLALAAFSEKHPKERPVIIAGRNAHSSFLAAAALLDFDIVWLWPQNKEYSICRCHITKQALIEALQNTSRAAGVYITSPDYLGNLADISDLCRTAHDYNVPVLVDNAHGAYLRFLRQSPHPMATGADICCDSAHKTLPVLTGGAYLHIGGNAPRSFFQKAREAMALFGSTSPSYLILQSLDIANMYLADGYPERLAKTVNSVEKLKARLRNNGWNIVGNEALKLTVGAKSYGYTGIEISAVLRERGIVCEYADLDYTVMMFTPENTQAEFSKVRMAFEDIKPKGVILPGPPELEPPKSVMSVRQAVFAKSRRAALSQALGHVAASLAVSCPPAVPPVAPGEIITVNSLKVCEYYGVKELPVIEQGYSEE